MQSTKSVEALVKAILEAPRSLLVGALRGRGNIAHLACLRKVLPHGGSWFARNDWRELLSSSAGQGRRRSCFPRQGCRVLLLDDLGTDEITKVSAVRDVVLRYDAAYDCTGIQFRVRLSRSMAAGSRVVRCRDVDGGLGVKDE